MQTKIKFTIKKNGQIVVAVEGVQGQSCTELTDELLRELGPVKDQQLTGEYYQKPSETTQRLKHG